MGDTVPRDTDTDMMPQPPVDQATDMPPVLPTMTDTDTLPQLMVYMPTEDMDTEPQDTRPQDMMLQDTEESTRLRSARRSDLTPPTTSTKQCISFVLLW